MHALHFYLCIWLILCAKVVMIRAQLLTRLPMFTSIKGNVGYNNYSKTYFISKEDVQQVIDGGVSMRIIVAEVSGVNTDVSISQTTTEPQFSPNSDASWLGALCFYLIVTEA